MIELAPDSVGHQQSVEAAKKLEAIKQQLEEKRSKMEEEMKAQREGVEVAPLVLRGKPGNEASKKYSSIYSDPCPKKVQIALIKWPPPPPPPPPTPSSIIYCVYYHLIRFVPRFPPEMSCE